LYVRVSTEGQEDNYSLPAQRRVLTEWAGELGYRIVKTYEDVASAKDDQRPDFLEMMTDAKNGLFDCILVISHDRFMRDLRLLLNAFHDLTESGVKLRCHDWPFDPYTPEGRMMLQNLGGFAEYFRAQLQRKIRTGVAEKMHGGEWFGRPPYGYRVVSDVVGKRNTNTRLEPIPEEQEVVSRIAALHDAGKNDSEIARALNESGVRTKKGAIWRSHIISSVLRTKRLVDERGPRWWKVASPPSQQAVIPPAPASPPPSPTAGG